ncbi:MAG: hypothetical protein LBP53_07095 [Candidatus Peribacteria bacterium]|jgi:ribosomal protein S18 acetylase RimI-like enzyme|nr:hypothetical protein [Candidatus Peribacteria bacterium]
MLIRPATSQDAEQILSINFKARKEGYRGLIDQAYLETRVITPERIYKFAEKIQSTKHCLVYENETYELLGYIDVGTPRDENIAYGYEVHSFYVLPEYQRIGI